MRPNQPTGHNLADFYPGAPADGRICSVRTSSNQAPYGPSDLAAFQKSHPLSNGDSNDLAVQFAPEPHDIIDPFGMQQKRQGLTEKPAPSFQDQLRESLGIEEDNMDPSTDNKSQMEGVESASGAMDTRRGENVPRSRDGQELGIYQKNQFLLQARPVDKFRNDQNIKFGKEGNFNSRDRQMTQTTLNGDKNAPSIEFKGVIGNEIGLQKTSVLMTGAEKRGAGDQQLSEVGLKNQDPSSNNTGNLLDQKLVDDTRQQKSNIMESQPLIILEDENGNTQGPEEEDESLDRSGQAVGPLTIADDEVLSVESPDTVGKHLPSIKQTFASLVSTSRAVSGHEKQQEEILQKKKVNSGQIPYELLAGQQLDSAMLGARHLSNDDAFLMGNKSPIITVESMEDDTQIQLKISHNSDGQASSPATAGEGKRSSGNKKRSNGRERIHAMTDDYSSTNSNSRDSLDKNDGKCGSEDQRHIMEDNGTCSDDYCDHLESSRCATRKQSTVVSDVNLFDSQTKLDSHHGLMLCQSGGGADRPEIAASPEENCAQDLLLREEHDACNYSLRLKRKKNCYQGDRFIPLRSGERDENQGRPGESDGGSHGQLQFQYEEDMLRCQTQIRKSKKRHEHKNKQKRGVEARGVDSRYDPLMSPSFDNDFQLADGLGIGEGNEGSQGNDQSPSNQSKTNSKGSPNDEKNKQIYRHMLAQQCLGDEIFNLKNAHQSLSSASLTLPQSYLNTQLDLNMHDESQVGTSAALQLGPQSMFLDPSVGVSHMVNNDFTDPFATGSLLMRNTTESTASRLHGSPLSASTAPGGASSDSTSGNLCIQSRDKILKHSTAEALQLASTACSGGPLGPSSHILSSFEDNSYNPLKLGSDEMMTSGFDNCGIGLGAGFSGDSSGHGDFGKPRRINKMPYKVLDAPQLQDDFYLNLVDWSATNVLAVGLNKAVYVWSACTSQVKKLCEVVADNKITSVGWSNKGNHLAVGTDHGETQIWDINHGKQIRSLSEHHQRISAIAWNGSTLSTGSKDKMVLSRDLRMKNCITHHYAGHKQEVCGLKWSYDGQQLASGGNDNRLMIWNRYSDQPVAKFSEHQAAVKAIAWNPNQSGLLATGGGTADRCIRFWNTHTLQPINCIDTGSQVCNLMFSKTSNELVSTHGYSLNQIIVWKYPSMRKIQTLTGHSYRVLYLSMSPCGSNIVTGAGDETLRFWNVFPSIKSQRLGTVGLSGGVTSSIQPSHLDMR